MGAGFCGSGSDDGLKIVKNIQSERTVSRFCSAPERLLPGWLRHAAVPSEHAPQRAGQLVGARGPLAVAVDALEPGDGLLDLHAPHQRGDALRIAVASAREGHAADDVSVGFDVDLSRAGAHGGVGEVFEHVVVCECSARHGFGARSLGARQSRGNPAASGVALSCG